MSIQEAVPLEDNRHLTRFFSPEILGRLPTVGQDRIRRTTLGVVGKYILPNSMTHKLTFIV
jgi:hypothetical protein